jgi:hypothetical protein
MIINCDMVVHPPRPALPSQVSKSASHVSAGIFPGLFAELVATGQPTRALVPEEIGTEEALRWRMATTSFRLL